MSIDREAAISRSKDEELLRGAQRLGLTCIHERWGQKDIVYVQLETSAIRKFFDILLRAEQSIRIAKDNVIRGFLHVGSDSLSGLDEVWELSRATKELQMLHTLYDLSIKQYRAAHEEEQ